MGQARPGPAGPLINKIAEHYEYPQAVTKPGWPLVFAHTSAYGRFNISCALNLPPNRAELTNQLAVAALGAGVITTLAVAQGQSPLTALGITLISAIAAVAVGQVL